VTVTPIFEEGTNVAHTIQRVAQEQNIGLKVMATRGRSRSTTMLLGSVTAGVIIEACTPVLVVKHFDARLGVLQVLMDRRFRQGEIRNLTDAVIWRLFDIEAFQRIHFLIHRSDCDRMKRRVFGGTASA